MKKYYSSDQNYENVPNAENSQSLRILTRAISSRVLMTHNPTLYSGKFEGIERGRYWAGPLEAPKKRTTQR